MTSLKMCLIAVAIVFATIQTVSSINCHTCNPGILESKCNVTEKVDQPCGTLFNRCLSIRYGDGTPYLLACTNNAKYCDNGLYARCKVCEGNNCNKNASSFITPSIFTITIFITLITKMYL